MRVLSQHYGKYRASGRALRDKIISLSSQCRRSSFLKQPMEEAGPSLPSFQVLRAIDARELAGSGDTAWRLPARAPSARELEEVVKRIENDRPGLSIERPVHILLGAASRCRSTSRRVSHVCTRQMRGKPLLRLSDGVGVCSAPFACVQAAPSAKNKIDLLELAYELCGTYRTRRTSTAPAYQVPPLMTMRSLRSFVSLNPSIAGARIVARVLPYLAETKQALVLGLPTSYGGYGLGIPRMNYEVKAIAGARTTSGRSSFRCDLCWPDAKLDVEYQSREMHEGEESRIRDSRRTNALMAMGWTVVGVTNDELDSLAATDAIADTIRRLLGKRVQVRDYHRNVAFDGAFSSTRKSARR